MVAIATEFASPQKTPAAENALWGQVQLPGYRYYNPEMGRWVSRDPLWEEGFRQAAELEILLDADGADQNPYGYLENTPTDHLEYLGLLAATVTCTEDCEMVPSIPDSVCKLVAACTKVHEKHHIEQCKADPSCNFCKPLASGCGCSSGKGATLKNWHRWSPKYRTKGSIECPAIKISLQCLYDAQEYDAKTDEEKKCVRTAIAAGKKQARENNCQGIPSGPSKRGK